MKKVLITGSTGMVGSHLADMIIAEHPEVTLFCTKRWRSPSTNVGHLVSKANFVDCDLMDASSCRELIEQTRPDYIFHLAAQSYVLDSWKHPQTTITNNTIMQLNLFEAIRYAKIDPIIQLALSSEEYGRVYLDEVPINEDNPLRPLSPYAVSKVSQDMLGYQYFMSYGLKVIRTRAFNHEGPRRGEVFVTSDFARQVAEIEAGLREPVIYVGNLEARRDWTDVRDMVQAYWLSVQHCTPGEVYVIASGKSRAIKEMLDILINLAGIKPNIVVDPERLRPSDVVLLEGNPTKFKQITKWEPKITFEQTMSDILNYWRHQLQISQVATAIRPVDKGSVPKVSLIYAEQKYTSLFP